MHNRSADVLKGKRRKQFLGGSNPHVPQIKIIIMKRTNHKALQRTKQVPLKRTKVTLQRSYYIPLKRLVMPRRFTFKKDPPTGYKSAGISYTDIKIANRICGCIRQRHYMVKGDMYRIDLMIRKKPVVEDPAPYEWFTLEVGFDTAALARQYLNNEYKKIQKDYKLYLL